MNWFRRWICKRWGHKWSGASSSGPTLGFALWCNRCRNWVEVSEWVYETFKERGAR